MFGQGRREYVTAFEITSMFIEAGQYKPGHNNREEIRIDIKSLFLKQLNLLWSLEWNIARKRRQPRDHLVVGLKEIRNYTEFGI